MKTRDEEFAALLRWYPRRWRAAHGAVVLGTLLDEADANGCDRPSAAQRRSAAWTGLGHRLDRRVAIITAIIAAALAIVAVATMYAPTPGLSETLLEAITIDAAVRMLAIAVSLALTIVSLVATLRTRGLPAVWAVWAALGGVLTGASVVAVQLSWAVGFDAADAGIPPSPLGDALPVLLLASLLCGGATAMCASAPFVRGRFAAAAWPATFVIGGVVWAVAVGSYQAMNPPVTALCALGALVIAVDPTSAQRTAQGRTVPPVASVSTARQRRTIVLLCAVSSVLGFAAIVLCIAGPRWTSLDGTRALQVGIGLGMLAACPLAVAVALPRARLTAQSRRTGPRGSARVWAPPALWCAGLIIAASANLFASPSDSNTVFVMLQVAAVPIATGIAWWIVTIPQGTPAVRGVSAVAAGIAVMLFAATLQMLPFAAPVLATIMLVATARIPNRPRSGSHLVANPPR